MSNTSFALVTKKDVNEQVENCMKIAASLDICKMNNEMTEHEHKYMRERIREIVDYLERLSA